MSKIPFFLCFTVIVFFSSSADQRLHSRHLLHQAFYPIPPPPSPCEPPSPSPHKSHHHKKQPPSPPPQDKNLFSSVTSPPPPPTPHSNPFFPSNAVHPSPPPPPASIPTFPANISSLFFPPSKPNNNRHVARLVSITVSVVSSSVLLALLVAFIIFLRRRRRRRLPAYDTKSIRSDSLLLNASPSNASRKHKQRPNASSDFLYLGTLVNSRSEGLPQQKSPTSGNVAGVLPPAPATSSSSSSAYSHHRNPGSPELRPLPPLPKAPAFSPVYLSPEQLFPKRQDFDGDDDEFFSPRGSSGRKQSPPGRYQSGNGSNSCSPTSFNNSPAASLKPKSLSPPLSQTSSNDSVLNQPGPVRPPPPPPPSPPPPPQFCEIPATTSLSPPSDPLKPKLKALHWDKVRASSSRVMVWDQIKSNSFQ